MYAIPYNETVNGILIIRRTNKTYLNDTLIECKCLCGETIERTARNVRNGSIYPCDKCRVKYNIKIDNNQ